MFKKKYYVLILIGVIALLSTLGTYAWWKWSSNVNPVVHGEICVPEIVFQGGTTIDGSNMLPVRTKEEGLKKDIKINLDSACNNETIVLNLKMELHRFPSSLADPSFKWALYSVTTEEVQGTPTEVETLATSGNFYNKVENTTIDLATDLVVSSSISTYRLYIWIDANMDNPSTLGGNGFIFKLYGQGRDAIYRENVMGDYHYDTAGAMPSYLFVSSLPRTSIESIEITKTSEMPDGVTSYDISSNNDGTVKLWYILNPETNLNKVYIGSESGIVKANTSMARMFAYLENAVSIDLSNLDTSSVTAMNQLFNKCYKLETINLSNFDTSNVTDMQAVFQQCNSLTSIDLSSFNTSNVTNMRNMFSSCYKLESLDLSHFNTSKVTTMTDMFQRCDSLTSLDLSSFNTSNVTDMDFMFYGCKSLAEINLSNFNTLKVTTMRSMFENCSALATINLNSSNFNTSNVTDMSYMFRKTKISDLTVLNNFNTSKVTKMAAMFHDCTNITSLNGLQNWDVSKVDYYSIPSDYNDSNFSASDINVGIFQDLTNLVDASAINNWNIKSTAYFTNMFYNSNNVHPTFSRVSGTWNNGTFTPSA